MEIIRKTIENDEEYLRQISRDVSFDDKSYINDIKLLEEFCNNTECFCFSCSSDRYSQKNSLSKKY